MTVEIEKGPYRALEMFRCQGGIPDRFKIIRHEYTPLEGALNRQRFSKGVFLCVLKNENLQNQKENSPFSQNLRAQRWWIAAPRVANRR